LADRVRRFSGKYSRFDYGYYSYTKAKKRDGGGRYYFIRNRFGSYAGKPKGWDIGDYYQKLLSDLKFTRTS